MVRVEELFERYLPELEKKLQDLLPKKKDSLATNLQDAM